MNTTTQPKIKTIPVPAPVDAGGTNVTHDATAGKSPKSVEFGDFVTFDGIRYQIRGNGNRKQLWKVLGPT